MLSAALPGLELLLCVIFATLSTEVLLWFWAYRFNSFKSLKVGRIFHLANTERHQSYKTFAQSRSSDVGSA